MLDLAAFVGNEYEVKLLDGTVLKLKRPTQGMYSAVLQMQEDMKQPERAFEAVSGLFKDILNHNANGLTFTLEQLAAYDLKVIVYVIKDYFTYWSEEIKETVTFLEAQ